MHLQWLVVQAEIWYVFPFAFLMSYRYDII